MEQFGFSTRDLHLAAFLQAKGARLEDVERDGSVCWFWFSNQRECRQLEDGYQNGDVEVNVRRYVDALRQLKSRIFSVR